MKRFLAVLCLLPIFLQAQTEWIRHGDHISVGAEVFVPSFNAAGFTETSGFVAIASGRILIPGGSTLVLELPFMQSKQSYSSPFGSSSLSKSSIGNPYLGMEFGTGTTFFAFGLRPPLISVENASAAAAAYPGDFLHMERYAPKTLTIQLNFNANPTVADIVLLHFLAGPMIWFPTGSGSSKTEIFADYEIGAGVDLVQVRVGVGIAGRMILTEDNILPAQRAAHTLQIEAGTQFGPVHPGIFYRKPLGQEIYTHLVKSIFGGTISVEL